MSNCNCNSLSCGHRGPWYSCRPNWNCGNNTCGCVASDGTPACNPCAPWGTANDNCGGWGCGSSNCSGCSSCNGCGCSGCSSGNGCGSCGNWNCGSSGSSCDTTCSVCGCNPCTCNGCTSGSITSGCLVPRIISIGRTFQRRITQTLCVDDLPDCAESPLTLVSVTVCGQATWEQISECRQTLLRVTVPVAVQIRDCAGRCRTGHSTVTLTIPLCMNCPAQDFWRGQILVAPCIRLAAPVTEDEDGCFDAPLEVQAEVYLVRMQVVNR